MPDSIPPGASREFSLEPPDNERLANLCGPLDENLRLVESRLGVEIRRRGSVFRVQGSKAASAESLLGELFRLTLTEDITPEAVHLALRDHDRPSDEPAPAAGRVATDSAATESATNDDQADTGLRTLRGTIRARGANQREYLKRVRQNDLTFGVGPAGTGKTFLAVACAVEALVSERVQRIVLVRPAVEAGEKLGFLPGDLSQKVDPYLRPLYDALYEMLGFERVARLIERSTIEVAPLAYMRGRTLNNSFIILDESQNTTTTQMKMFLTRIGFGSTAVITGDVTQIDLPKGTRSGLVQVTGVLGKVKGVSFTWFNSGDVVRHPIVQRIVDAYDEYDRQQVSPLNEDKNVKERMHERDN